MPAVGENKLTFKNHRKQLPTPYVIYTDLGAKQHEASSYRSVVVRSEETRVL